MIDIQILRDDPEAVQKKSAEKGYDVDVQVILKLDVARREKTQAADELRQKRNELQAKSKGQRPSEEDIAAGKEIKEQLSTLEDELQRVTESFEKALRAVPNMPLDNVPVGATEEENVVEKFVGQKPEFDFKPRTHWEIAQARGMLDKERAAKISGSRFAYIKGGLVQLQFAIVQYVMDVLTNPDFMQQIIDENDLKISPNLFTPILPPALMHTEPYVASSRLDAENLTYKIEQDDLWLNASAEHTLCTMYWNEILPADQLPLRYIGYSTSFRREAGTYGKDTEGIIRLHQFDKLEMEVFSSAETGHEEHKLLIAIQEYLMQSLGIPYNFVRKCTADIGKPNAGGIDIDAWFPGQDRFIETHTADYMTDYQARDLKIRTKTDDGTALVHTNDATAFALSRILAAMIENYQTEEMGIVIPEVLKPYMGGRERI